MQVLIEVIHCFRFIVWKASLEEFYDFSFFFKDIYRTTNFIVSRECLQTNKFVDHTKLCHVGFVPTAITVG